MQTLFSTSTRPRFRSSVFPARQSHHVARCTGGAVTLPDRVRDLRSLATSYKVPGRSKARTKAQLIRLLTIYFIQKAQ